MDNAFDTALIADEVDMLDAWFIHVLKNWAKISVTDTAMKEILEVVLGPRDQLTFGILRDSFDAVSFVETIARYVRTNPPLFLVRVFASFANTWSPSVPWCDACRLPAIKPNRNRSSVEITPEPQLCPWCEETVVIAYPYNPTRINWVTRTNISDDQNFDISTGKKLPISERELSKMAPRDFLDFFKSVSRTLKLAEFLWYVMEDGHKKFALPQLAVEVYRAFTSNEYLHKYDSEYLRAQIVLAVRFWEDRKMTMIGKAPISAIAHPMPSLSVSVAEPVATAVVPVTVPVTTAPPRTLEDLLDVPLPGAWFSEKALDEILDALKEALLVSAISALEQDIPKEVLHANDRGYRQGVEGMTQRLRVLNFAGRLPDGQIPFAIFLRNAFIAAGSGDAALVFHAVLHKLGQNIQTPTSHSAAVDSGLEIRSPEQWKTNLNPDEQKQVRELVASVNRAMDENGPQVQGGIFIYKFRRDCTPPQQRVKDVIVATYTKSTKGSKGWRRVDFVYEDGANIIKFYPPV